MRRRRGDSAIRFLPQETLNHSLVPQVSVEPVSQVESPVLDRTRVRVLLGEGGQNFLDRDGFRPPAFGIGIRPKRESKFV